MLGLTCSVVLGWRRGTADVVRVCEECSPQLVLAWSLREVPSLRQVVHLPRGVGPGPWQSCAAQAPRKTWVATLSRSQLGGSCSHGLGTLLALYLPLWHLPLCLWGHRPLPSCPHLAFTRIVSFFLCPAPVSHSQGTVKPANQGA